MGGQTAQPPAHDRGIRDRETRCQNQDHLEGEGEDVERTRIPGIQDGRHRAARRENTGEDGDDNRQADRQYEGIGHHLFKDVDHPCHQSARFFARA